MSLRATIVLSGLVAAAGGLPVGAQVEPHGGMLRFPDVSDSHIVFVYANDLWIVSRDGGTAMPLASPAGAERFPKFNDSGDVVAFMGNYDGNTDLYTISVNGGLPQRVTHHPATEILSGWTSDGRLIFNMNGLAGLGRQQQIFTVDAAGGLPTKLPVPYGAAGAISDDGEWVAYTPFNRDTRTWKRYRGGLASDIWLFNLQTNEAEQMTDWEGTDSIPMWHGDVVYYVSDHGPSARLNIWGYDTATGERAQITNFSDHDVKWPSIGPGADGAGEIVFQHGSALKLLSLADNSVTDVEVTIPGDRPTLKPKLMDVSGSIQGGAISSTGKRAAVIARGELFSVPAQEGVTRALTDTDGAFERDPAWSPDGRWIAYFSDESGEYELYITQSDGRGETKQITKDSRTFYNSPIWSPDSKHILFTDKAGKKYLATIESGDVRQFDADPWFTNQAASWSHDSQWLAYSKSPQDVEPSSIWLYNVENDELHQVTSGMFGDTTPTFDRKGDFLYFASSRSFAPTYSDVDTTFIYHNSQVLLAVPLRDDVENPFVPESDEEEFKTDEEEEEEESEGEDTDEGEEGAADEAADESDDGEEAAPDDGVSGTWSCTMTGEMLPPDGVSVTMVLSMNAEHGVTGTIESPMGSASFSGTFDPASGALNGTVTTAEGESVTLSGTIKDGELNATAAGEGFAAEITGTRTSTGGSDGDEAGDSKEEAAETVEIDLDGFERRAIQLPVPPGNFGTMAVNDRNQLLYVRTATRGAGGGAAIKLFDINADNKVEQDVAAGAAGFDLSGDGKKILISRGNSLLIQNASAGSSGKQIDLSGLKTMHNPREEWSQILRDAWRLERDFFYDPTMHGVDWQAVYEQYDAMLPDAVNREDVGYIIAEMISELNVGHAYYGGGDVESGPNQNVGLLGVDFALENGAYRIQKIFEGAPWDSDARGPLSQPGVDVNEGDYLLAVNGVPLDPSTDPWAAFVGTVGKVVELTVNDAPEINDDARRVLVEPMGSEGDLRYRAWIESNRKYVDEATGGKVGYVYVPDTGVNGQTNLVRQFFGQIGKPAMIIDERWNGGGQIPTRFIEMLNRPRTNYWARRDMNDWPWPPDSHQGPMCMLINGPSGSGGDAFPYYFRQAGLGKLIGARTWGGLVGMSGQPPLIDGARVTVPTFAFYELDGTWGVEGHGVDPDIPVVADPSKMVDGGDPQLDAAIELMVEELQRNPYSPPARPAYPDRSGMGIPESDR